MYMLKENRKKTEYHLLITFIFKLLISVISLSTYTASYIFQEIPYHPKKCSTKNNKKAKY